VSNYTSGGAATTIYVGGLLEKVTTAAGTDYRYMIRAGGSTIIVSRKSSGVNSINYVTSDQLDSSSAITNSTGGILVNSSFDAFGKRRGSNWSGSPSAGDWTAIASTTRRGYTEHSMLDNLGLIHMNGRVQDPVLGRFISADPFITEPTNTQNYNRYSYVYNNPLSAVDPSGFGSQDQDMEGRQIHWCYDTGELCSARTNLSTHLETPCGSYACIYLSARIGEGHEIANSKAAPYRESATIVQSLLLGTHAVLGGVAVSEFPFASQVAGAADGLLSLGEGDWTGAGLSFAGMVPAIGLAADATKLARLGLKATKLTKTGAKSAAQMATHLEKLGDARNKVAELTRQLEKLKGPKAQNPVREEIQDLLDQIKGHEKEIRQKWPELGNDF
jgi:RHS repeat-associated protein